MFRNIFSHHRIHLVKTINQRQRDGRRSWGLLVIQYERKRVKVEERNLIAEV